LIKDSQFVRTSLSLIALSLICYISDFVFFLFSMDVTAKNFSSCCSLIQQAIKEATFIAIDGEFSGLLSDNSFALSAMDTVEERYHKLRSGAMDFLMFQFGLCTFQYVEDGDKYVVKPFNIYIFPRPLSREAHDVRFLCQSGSMDFLAAQGFDFNRVFREGVTYLTPADEDKQRTAILNKYQQMNERQQQESTTAPTPFSVPDEHVTFIENTISLLEDMLNSTESSIELPQCSGFLRKLLTQVAATRFPGQIHIEFSVDEKKQFHLHAHKAGPEEVKRLREAKMEKELAEVSDSVGFTRVVRQLSDSGKLIVGHNMILDVLHLVHRFWSPLPPLYADFKGLIGSVCPRVIDTKVMASHMPFKEHFPSTGLSDVHKGLLAQPFSQVNVACAPDFPQYTAHSDKLHEAGYDAFITGQCFATMLKHLATLQNTSLASVMESPLLRPYVNKLYLMRIADIPYMNLAGKDIMPQREHVFHLVFPREWKTSDIQQLFTEFGGGQVSWIDSTSAYVALNKPESAKKAAKKLITARKDGCKIQTYAAFVKQKAAQSAAASTPDSRSQSQYKWTASTAASPTKNGSQQHKQGTSLRGGNKASKSGNQLAASTSSSNEVMDVSDSMDDIGRGTASCSLLDSSKEEAGSVDDWQVVDGKKRKRVGGKPTPSKRNSSDKPEKLFEESDNWI
jgi:poly(A)-specific ribonuclease